MRWYKTPLARMMAVVMLATAAGQGGPWWIHLPIVFLLIWVAVDAVAAWESDQAKRSSR